MAKTSCKIKAEIENQNGSINWWIIMQHLNKL